MHDIKFIRQNPEAFDAGLKRRGLEPQSASILALDEQKRKLQTELQNKQSEKNRFAKEIGMAKAKGDHARAEELLLEQKVAVAVNAAGEGEVSQLEVQLNDILSSLPNMPAGDVPDGKDEHDNKEVGNWGKKPEFTFKPKEHFELGEALGLMDFEGAAKLSGARFVVLKGALARLERALANFFLDEQGANSYTEVVPPYLVRDQAMFGTGQLPKFKQDLYAVNITEWKEETLSAIFRAYKNLSAKNNLNESEFLNTIISLLKEATDNDLSARAWLIPTAEVPLTNLVADSILSEDQLPIRYTAYTPCFRSEAGAAGRDTRGMIRQHQFAKVEMVSITTPESSEDEHERMTKCAEALLQKLGLPYRTMLLCTGDMGFSSEKTYDIEVWLPGQGAYREISSCSNCGAFQARRMKARFKAKNAKDNQFVHTLNGSGLPIGRTMVAILENYQQADGSITIPEVLRPYMGGLEKIG